MARSRLPPGFRFHPTDEELLVHYLKRKAAGKFVDDWVIGEVDIYKFEPSELPDLAALRSRDSEWFFFGVQDKRNLHGYRTNRTTKAGYWKATGKDRKVIVGSCVGLKKTLIYYAGRAPHGERTDWVMHEYRLDEDVKRKMNSDSSFALCRVRRKSGLGPRNGEQYGAPVLEEELEEEASNSVNEVCVVPSPSIKFMGERQIQEVPSLATVIEGATMGMETRDDLNSFLQNLVSFDEPDQDRFQKGDLVMDELLCLLEDQSDLALTQAAMTTNLHMDSIMDGFCSMVRPTDTESVMLEDMLHLVRGQLQMPQEQLCGVQETICNSHKESLQSVGFLELADLEEPCDVQSPLELAALESLLSELDDGMDLPLSTRLVQDELQMQQNLQPSGLRENVRGLTHVGNSGISNEPEVLLDSSQGLSVLGSVQTRLLTSDNGAAPSGLISISDQEGASALSLSKESRAQEQPLCNLALSEAKLECADSTAGPPKDSSIQSVPSPPSPPSPSSLARVISGFLGKVNVLPASADELPQEWESHQLLEEESSVCSLRNKESQKWALTCPDSLRIGGSLLSSRVAELATLQSEKQIPELELQWLMSSNTILDQHDLKSCRSFANGFSLFLFRITTLALILFCMFRGFCRSIRIAFV
ncbi:hypothetical protein L7F22_050830 [Adiantum nelumboides]|nr:hypothetical protein [Adiantum nelumboides]